MTENLNEVFIPFTPTEHEKIKKNLRDFSELEKKYLGYVESAGKTLPPRLDNWNEEIGNPVQYLTELREFASALINNG